MTKKDILFGPRTNNECCVCCDKCWDNKPLDANSGCPRSCCTCPPLNDLCMTLDTAGLCPTVDGMEITLSKDVGVALCSGENPTSRDGQIKCYEYNPVSTLKSGIQGYINEYEKWGYAGIICDGLTVAGCDTVTAGEKLKVSLCCCNEPDEHINATILTPADCHTCSYRLTFEWERHVDNPESDEDDFCSCPEPDSYGAVEQIIPTCETAGPPIDCAITYLDLTFENGTCPTGNPSPDTPFLLHYELRTTVNDKRGWWNCDCCQNGIGPADNDVVLGVTIVEGAGTDGACS
jgi:hypothetical protein